MSPPRVSCETVTHHQLLSLFALGHTTGCRWPVVSLGTELVPIGLQLVPQHWCQCPACDVAMAVLSPPGGEHSSTLKVIRKPPQQPKRARH